MSYTLTAFTVDLDTLRRGLGSRDEALVAAIFRQKPERFGDESGDDEEVSLGRAVRDLVMGNPPMEGSAHQYGYALEHLCRHLGEPGALDAWESIRWEVLEASGADEILEKGPPVPLPKSDDFPRIGHLSVAEIQAILARAGEGPLTTAAPSGRKPRRSLGSRLLGLVFSGITQRGPLRSEDVAELLEEYEGCLREAAARGKSLVFFYY